jgi:hypothetical protein
MVMPPKIRTSDGLAGSLSARFRQVRKACHFERQREILAGADIFGTLEDFSPRSLVLLAYLVEMTTEQSGLFGVSQAH